jgi:hypothetical protein
MLYIMYQKKRITEKSFLFCVTKSKTQTRLSLFGNFKSVNLSEKKQTIFSFFGEFTEQT